MAAVRLLSPLFPALSHISRVHGRNTFNSRRWVNSTSRSFKMESQPQSVPVKVPARYKVVAALESIAPKVLASDWDNVGVLVDPPFKDEKTADGSYDRPPRVMCTIDLTETVVEEAIKFEADVICTYHPVIFSGLKQLLSSNSLQRVVMRAVQHGILIYSPHTALDCAPGGVNDWLADGLGEGQRQCIEIDSRVMGAGLGRVVALQNPIPLSALVQRVKTHLGLQYVRVATPSSSDPMSIPVRTVALCAGSGGSVCKKVKADVWLTGEMGHHDVLAAAAAGTSVILSEHTHTERGYLQRLRTRLLAELPAGSQVAVASSDKDPLFLC